TAITAVKPAAATHFSITAPGSTIAGSLFGITVIARDQFNNTATAYAGTIAFASSDQLATLPSSSTLTNGSKTFNGVILEIAASQTISATDNLSSSLTGTSPSIIVNPGPAKIVSLRAPQSTTVGLQFTLFVTALDAFGNRATGY